MIRVEVVISEPDGKVPESAFAGAEAAAGVKHLHESLRDMPHSFPSFQLWEVVTNYGNGRFKIRQGRLTKDWVRALDHRAKLYLHPGSVVVVGFENRNPDRPYIRGIYGIGRLARQYSPLVGVWLQGQGQPSLAARSPSTNVLVTVTEGATDLGAIAAAETIVEEASLGLVVGTFAGTALGVWLTGGRASGRYTNRLYAIRLDDFSPVWQLDLPAGHTSPASGTRDGSNLFLEDTSGMLFAIGHGGTDGRRVSVVDARGALVTSRVTPWELTNTSVANSRFVKGWHTQGGYDGRDQSDPLIRSWALQDQAIVESWNYDPRTLLAGLRDHETASANSADGRWPVNPVNGQLLVWVSGWLVPDTTGEDAYLSRSFTKTYVGPLVQDPAYATTAIVRDGPHRFQRAGIVSIDMASGNILNYWLTDNDSNYHQTDTTSIAAWDAYFSGGGAPIHIADHSPSGAGVYIGFADHQSIDLGMRDLRLTIGNRIQLASTCAGQPDFDNDTRYEVAPYVEPARGNHGAVFAVQSSDTFSWPDYKWFMPGHQLLLPHEDATRFLNGDDIFEWGTTDSFLRVDPVGACLAPSSDGFVYVAWMEQEGFIVGSGDLIPAFPVQNDPEVSTLETACPGPGGSNVFITTVESVTWFTYQKGKVQHGCKTWLAKIDSGLGEVWKVDATRRAYILIDGPPGVGSSTSDQQRGIGDNAFQIEPVPQVGKLLWLRDNGGGDYRGIEVRDLADGSLLEMYVSPEATTEITVDGHLVRKWDECFWADGPASYVYAAPERRSGVDADGLPWVMWFFNVRLHNLDGTFTVKHRAWRIYWGDGLGAAPRNEIQDYTSTDFPGGLAEVVQLALANDLAIWPSSNYESGPNTYSLLALRLP